MERSRLLRTEDLYMLGYVPAMEAIERRPGLLMPSADFAGMIHDSIFSP